MGRISTFPTTVEDCLCLSMKDLRKWGYLKPNSWKSGTVTVSRGGRVRAKYGITINIYDDKSFLQFSYTITKHTGEKIDIDYKVKLVTKPSNLGKGVRYYFLCPYTHKLCFKLYSPPNENYFLHRSAFPYLVYEKQTQSKTYRALENSVYGLYFKSERLAEEVYKKNAKQYYRGKPTPNMKKYLKVQRQIEGVRSDDIARMWEDVLIQ